MMTTQEIIQSASSEGVSISLSAEKSIRLVGDQQVVEKWRPIIRDNKAGIIKTLLESQACTGDLDAIRSWLVFIGEDDPAIVALLIGTCHQDTEARNYFLQRSRRHG